MRELARPHGIDRQIHRGGSRIGERPGEEVADCWKEVIPEPRLRPT